LDPAIRKQNLYDCNAGHKKANHVLMRNTTGAGQNLQFD